MTEIDKLQKTVRSYESEQDRLNEQLTAHRIELTRLREENAKLKTYLAKKYRNEERVKMIIEERDSMQAVVAAAREVMKSSGYANLFSLQAKLKALDERGEG